MKLLLLTLLCFSQCVLADLYLIAHKSFTVDSVDASIVKDIYSGDTQYINDIRIIPLDQDINSENYSRFYGTVVDRPMAQIISHWSKLIFTGKGQAPISLSGDMSIINFVKNSPNAIGYIEPKFISNDVKIIHKIKITRYKELNIDSLKNR